MFRAVPLPLSLIKEGWVERLHRPKGDIPYGVALSAAALWIYPQTLWVVRRRRLSDAAGVRSTSPG